MNYYTITINTLYFVAAHIKRQIVGNTTVRLQSRTHEIALSKKISNYFLKEKHTSTVIILFS